MPAHSATVTAVYSILPSPSLISVQLLGGTNLFITASAYPNQPWVLQESADLQIWASISTNLSDATGLLQLTHVFNSGATREFFRLKSP